ncbi:MAG: AAA family ATPase, partial [Candidatus Saccharimonadales bacterium]
MAAIDFNYHSGRAQKARISHAIRGSWQNLLQVAAVCLLIGGVGAIITGFAVGWVLLGVSVLPLMVTAWYDGELRHLPTLPEPDSIDDILSADVLGQLPKSPTPYDVATAVGRVQSGQFFALRFGISPRFLQEIASKEQSDMPAVWTEALKVRSETGVPHVSGSVLAAALLRSFPNHQGLLAPLQIGDEDILRGVQWQQHIRELIDRSKMPKRTGGIARDWSFGYIPLLTKFGQNISEQMGSSSAMSVDIVSHTRVLDQLLTTFGSAGRQNAVLVGAAGVGKTTIIRAFAERLLDASSKLPDDLKFRQVFILDSSALISAAPGRGELENLVMRILGEAYSAKNVIICLDNAQLFFEEGIGSVDLSNVLLPILEVGRLRIMLTMDEQRFMQIGQRNSALVNALNRIVVEPADKEETLRIMQNELIMTEYRRKVSYRYQALQEAYRLSERYVHDLAMPGRAVKMMESAASYAEDGVVTSRSVQQAIEQTMNIKVGVATGDEERQKLLELEDLIHKRMINQTRAVGVVSDALRRARAGVRNQER